MACIRGGKSIVGIFEIAVTAAYSVRGTSVREGRAFGASGSESVVAERKAIPEAYRRLCVATRPKCEIAATSDLVNDAIVIGDVGSIIARALCIGKA